MLFWFDDDDDGDDDDDDDNDDNGDVVIAIAVAVVIVFIPSCPVFFRNPKDFFHRFHSLQEELPKTAIWVILRDAYMCCAFRPKLILSLD